MAYRRSALMEERLAGNRTRITRAARQLVAQSGFRGASIAAVAKAAGLSTGAIYRYFPSKAELFVEVLEEAVRRECELLTTIISGTGSAEQRLCAAVESFTRRAVEGPNLAYAFIAEPADPTIEAARLLYRQAFSDIFKTLLRKGVASGEFPQQPVEVSAACIVGAFTEALAHPPSGTTRRMGDDQRIRAIVEFCRRAVVGRPRATG